MNRRTEQIIREKVNEHEQLAGASVNVDTLWAKLKDTSPKDKFRDVRLFLRAAVVLLFSGIVYWAASSELKSNENVQHAVADDHNQFMMVMIDVQRKNGLRGGRIAYEVAAPMIARCGRENKIGGDETSAFELSTYEALTERQKLSWYRGVPMCGSVWSLFSL